MLRKARCHLRSCESWPLPNSPLLFENGRPEEPVASRAAQVEADPLFHRYRRYYASDHRAIQHYGKVLLVVDEFLGPNEASGPATAMTTLAE
eukprot:scaffold98990_cov37-Prasinocladus_malaysianus.AAC.1